MSPVYLNPQHSSSMPFLELGSNNNSYFPHSTFGHHHNSAGVQVAIDYDYSRRVQEKVEKLVISQAKPNDLGQILASPHQLQYTTDGNGCSYNYPFDDHQIRRVNCSDDRDQKINNKLSKNYKPAKLKIMHKMTVASNKSKIITGDHDDHKLHPRKFPQPYQSNYKMYRNNGNEISNGLIRVCSDCHTTTTPLWRSGPQGPKSLCNACGIRQRKARRAAMAAVAAAAAATELARSATVAPPKTEEMIKPQRKPDHHHDMSHTLPIKKRSKMTNASWNNYNNNNNNNNNSNNNYQDFEDFALSSSKNYFTTTSQRVFPRDEEEGAILLMALSCDLPCSS